MNGRVNVMPTTTRVTEPLQRESRYIIINVYCDEASCSTTKEQKSIKITLQPRNTVLNTGWIPTVFVGLFFKKTHHQILTSLLRWL